MSRILAVVTAALLPTGLLAADSDEHAPGTFEGKVIVEWLDDDPYVPKLRLTESFSFRQPDGKTWTVPTGTVLDGRSLPALFVSVMGAPFESVFRKTALVYDYAAQSQEEPWEDAQRMFHDGAIAEGVVEVEAEVMYMLLYATGLRWPVRGAVDCYGRCHARDAELEWSPKVRDEQVLGLVGWVRANNPPLEEIERQVDDVILEKGPHIIGRIRVAPQQ